MTQKQVPFEVLFALAAMADGIDRLLGDPETPNEVLQLAAITGLEATSRPDFKAITLTDGQMLEQSIAYVRNYLDQNPI